MTDNTCVSIEERFKAEEEMNEFMKQKKREALDEVKKIRIALFKLNDIYDDMDVKRWEHEKVVDRDLFGEFDEWMCSGESPINMSLDDYAWAIWGWEDALAENLENTK